MIEAREGSCDPMLSSMASDEEAAARAAASRAPIRRAAGESETGAAREEGAARDGSRPREGGAAEKRRGRLSLKLGARPNPTSRSDATG